MSQTQRPWCQDLKGADARTSFDSMTPKQKHPHTIMGRGTLNFTSSTEAAIDLMRYRRRSVHR